MPRRMKILLTAETAALAAALLWIAVLLFGAELPPSPYESVNTCPDVTFQAARPYSAVFPHEMDFTLANASKTDAYRWGDGYKMEVKQDSVWCTLPFTPWAIEDILYGVQPNGTAAFTERWFHSYGELSPGSYRVIKEIRNERTGGYFLVAAEFEIPDTEA